MFTKTQRHTHEQTHTKCVHIKTIGLIQTESWKRKCADLYKHTLAAMGHLKQTYGLDTLPLPSTHTHTHRVHTCAHTPTSTS